MQQRSLFHAVFPLAFVAGCATGLPDRHLACSNGAEPPLKNLQYVTSHNAYHIAPDAEVFNLMAAYDVGAGTAWPADRIRSATSFTHPPLREQLAMGVRAFELDVHDDPTGGKFARPGAYELLRGQGKGSDEPIDPEGALLRPGFKTFHEADVDVRSHCPLFSACLEAIDAWRQKNPAHAPIFILLEVKEGAGLSIGDLYAPASPSRLDRAGWSRLQAEILNVFDRRDLIAPGDLVAANGVWPTLAEARGKLAFLLFSYGDRIPERYADAMAESGEAALLHLSRGGVGIPQTWRHVSDPKGLSNDAELDPRWLLYTKADTTGVRDLSRRDHALASAANFIATDYLTPTDDRADYSVTLDGSYTQSRCTN